MPLSSILSTLTPVSNPLTPLPLPLHEMTHLEIPREEVHRMVHQGKDHREEDHPEEAPQEEGHQEEDLL